ncbi:DnaJ-domain-containing protein [Cantharellus anzutake]|uniref:DnaJ-domain-containing protein n=1 Tax=Cantharellus anzutake TaxID=1750568 RepID=UPI00190621FE|nr:DnaJ-domain-containing protein [Cantharellus anzutake]KAF8332405.1 DnaJ-domain-containing protein [Cantharellus anzutake]
MSSQPQIPQYYDLLGIPPTASLEEIRAAYKKESLRTHPDRKPDATPEERKKMTEQFQAVADAYYVLSSPQRRKEYDALLRSRGYSSSKSGGANQNSGADAGTGAGPFPFFTTDPAASAAFFEQFKSFFTPRAEQASSSASNPAGMDAEGEFRRPDPESVFGDVFEELLRPEVERRVSWWSYLGALSGGTLGYILGNIPGAIAGSVAGNRLGAIRDAKGKPVISVFAQLGGSQKAEILKVLAFKVLGSIGSM